MRVRLLNGVQAVLLILVISSCQSAQQATAIPQPSLTSSVPSPIPTRSSPWTEEEVIFASGPYELYGILTLPTNGGPYPAIVLISGSGNPSTGVRDGASSLLHVDHARRLVLNGFAVLRYDPPGVGRSTGDHVIQSLDDRAEEAIAAARYLQSHTDIRREQVGLWGVSQGGWVIQIAAAEHPEDVALIISVSGSGVSNVEQQVYSVEAQSRAAGLSEEDTAKAVLFSRLLIDWQLSSPIYREVNEADAGRLGDGPWNSFMQLVYEPGSTSPAEGLEEGIDILESIQDEPWAEFLYLRGVYLPALRSIPPDQVTAAKAASEESLLVDPRDFLTRVRCPVLAVFGEADMLLPAERSAALYEEYLTRAGNGDFTIVVFPGADHSLNGFLPAYWETLSNWLQELLRQEGGV